MRSSRALGPAMSAALSATLAAAALAGCGSAQPTARPTAPATSPSSAAEASTAPAPQGAVHTVKLEVLGKGRSMQPIVYVAGSSGSVTDAALPWSKTEKIEMTPAEQRVGRLVSIVAGSVQAGNGMLEAARCRITLDGTKVADGEGMCKFTIKDKAAG
ncbi:hypothetical protein [Nonomuraea indica]|uniref:hypothetical protein n=1 Tax=Nonomuraea indica TaxID=1581193 RepID=UPI0015DE9B4A|nr:hypothetical protein [Nonomuraea indica]